MKPLIRRDRPRHVITLLGCMLLLAGCASPAQRFERLARQAELQQVTVTGNGFGHHIYRRGQTPQARGLLLVYLEGDGQPGAHEGTRPSTDPTPRKPLALQMMTTSSRAAIYLTRPCYNGLSRTPECSSALWTSARYSGPIVASLCAALDQYRAQSEVDVVLVGFSGGGTLAMLMAQCVRNLRGIITVAANLDTDAWTSLHGYQPLDDSLNPARLTGSRVPVVHYVGGRDLNVPPSMLEGYFSAHVSESVLRMPEFDHACCWVGQWPALLETAMAELTGNKAWNPAIPISAGP